MIREVTQYRLITTVVGGDGGLLYTNTRGRPPPPRWQARTASRSTPTGNIFIADEKFNVVRS